MKFKVTLRNKFNAEVTTDTVEADNEKDVKDEYNTQATQVLSVRPIGQKAEKPVKSTYLPIRILRNRVEKMLCDKAMGINKFAPLTEEQKAEIRMEFAMLNEECPDLG